MGMRPSGRSWRCCRGSLPRSSFDRLRTNQRAYDTCEATELLLGSRASRRPGSGLCQLLEAVSLYLRPRAHGRRSPMKHPRMWMMVALVLGSIWAFPGGVIAGGPGRAREVLAEHLNTTLESVIIVRTEFVEFTDACMGLRAEGFSCEGRLPAVTNGNVVWLRVGEHGYRYHGSDEFNALKLAAGPFPADQISSASLPAGAKLLVPHGLPSAGSGGLADPADVGDSRELGFLVICLGLAALGFAGITGLGRRDRPGPWES